MRLPAPASTFAAAGASVRRVDGRHHVDLSLAQPAFAVASGMVSVFVARRRADGTAGRRAYLGTVAPGGVVPMLTAELAGSPFTVVAVPDGRALVVDAPAGVPACDEAVVEGRFTFARAMIPAEARVSASTESEAMAALIARAAELAALDEASVAAAVSARSGAPARAQARSLRVIGSVFGLQDELLNVDPSLPPLLRACRHVAVEAGVPLAAIPRRIPADPLLSPTEAFAHAARIGCRRIELPDRWWRGDFGPILGQAGDAPVALVPAGRGGYRAFTYEPGVAPRGRTVDRAFAATLAPDAVAFAAPLPASVTGVRSLAAFVLGGSAPDLWIAGAVSLAGSFLNLAVPFATGLLVSRLIPAGNGGSLLFLGLALGSAILAVAACDLVTRFLLLRVETRATVRGSSAVILRTLQLPIAFFRRNPVGDLAERLGVIEQVQRRITGTMVVSVVGGAFSLTYLGLMAAIDPLAAFASALAFLAIFAVTAFVARQQARLASDAAERSGRLSGFALQLLDGIDRIRTTGTEEHALLQWLQRYRPERRAMYRASIAAARLRVLGLAVPFAAAGFLWWRFAALPGSEEVKVAAFMAFNAAFSAALAAIAQLGTAVGDISEAIPLLDRLSPILEERPESDPGAETPGELSGAIALQDVRFAYPGSAGEVVRGVSLEASPGDFVAIVGASGSGKSTLAQLILGLLRPTAGKVLFDGRDLGKLDLPSVRRQLGVVGQHARVMPGTMLENIVGATLLTQDDAWEAAEAAGLADDIRDMPMQMHTFVNEHTLSGGQLQKLLIARALVTRPVILLFDEATSALDEVSQAHVSAALAERAVTRIVIAHRLSTVRLADRIHVLSAGEVVQTGTFDELAAVEGPFRELVRRQLLDAPAVAGGAA